ncbi:dTDP-4-amino-4,6-dideoxygalactose transaminase [Salinibacter ruber]|uniref:DegT/DnrJ/EryC1/StrS family aminotransferase n=1 Tax=Salinibacter ruber TaxID=146919 RepID=UPI002167A17E|nr:DegT/DnrJ/EryC1/StrS family aminotransferase [Salinibacter ruber]MCS3855304.1 dTDP-4-amino-4,6-dideoxygalactose transaminase [Salinibacter ruber]
MKDNAMPILRNGIRVMRGISRDLYEFINGKPLMTPPFVGGTLEAEDARRAQIWLRRREQWYDPDPVVEFEEKFADWNGSKHARAFMGGRVALSAIIHALGLGDGDEVLLPGYTCIVVPNAFHYANVDITYADIELETFGPSVDAFAQKISDRTSAILIHHLYGLVCRDYEGLLQLADENDLYVIEDCTHATGATFRGKKVGNYGDAAFYSSEHSKCLSTVQGGIATTDDDSIAARLGAYARSADYPRPRRLERLLYTLLLDYYEESHPQRWWVKYAYQLLYGNKRLKSTTDAEKKSVRPDFYGQRMPAPLASIGVDQLTKLPKYNKIRRESAAKWDRWSHNHGYETPYVLEDSQPSWLRYPLLVEPERKKDTSWAVEKLGVEIGDWFRTHLHPVERSVKGCPNADHAVSCCINLPTILK